MGANKLIFLHGLSHNLNHRGTLNIKQSLKNLNHFIDFPTDKKFLLRRTSACKPDLFSFIPPQWLCLFHGSKILGLVNMNLILQFMKMLWAILCAILLRTVVDIPINTDTLTSPFMWRYEVTH